MEKQTQIKTVYYNDELNDDFAGNNIKTKQLPKNYKYSKSAVRKFFAFILYYVIALPLVFILQKTVYAEKTVGKSKLKKARKTGYFIYGNHTRGMGDAYTPALTVFPKKAYIIAGSDAVSIPLIHRLVEDLGVIPVPQDTDIGNCKKFYLEIARHAEKNHVIAVYPEAHIWPYCTTIRNFKDVSFKYPAKFNKPVYSFTVTFKKRKIFKRPKTVVYIDGPFYPDQSKSVKENQTALRNAVYDAMVINSKKSDCELIKYVKATN